MRCRLRNEGLLVNGKRIHHLMRPMPCRVVDLGSQFTSLAWADRLRRSGARISMDGKGRFLPSLNDVSILNFNDNFFQQYKKSI